MLKDVKCFEPFIQFPTKSLKHAYNRQANAPSSQTCYAEKDSKLLFDEIRSNFARYIRTWACFEVRIGAWKQELGTVEATTLMVSVSTLHPVIKKQEFDQSTMAKLT